MKRLVRVAALAAVALGLSAGTAQAQRGAPDFHIIDNPLFVYADGPGFNVLMTKHGIHTNINDDRFGIPSAGFPIQRATQQIPAAARPIVCDGGTYRTVGSLTFTTTERASSTATDAAPGAVHAAVQHALPEDLHLRGHGRGHRREPRPTSSSSSTRPTSRTRSSPRARSPRRTRSMPTSSTRAGACASTRRSSGRVNVDLRDRQRPAQDHRPRHLPPDGEPVARPPTAPPSSARSSCSRSTRRSCAKDSGARNSRPFAELFARRSRADGEYRAWSDERATPDRLLRARRP